MADTNRRLLATLGVDADTEHVYRMLLDSPGANIKELRAASGFGSQRLRSALDQLERRAMITQRSGTPTQYHAAPPELVIDALISAREGELKQARLVARQLTSVLREPPPGQPRVTDVVEVLGNPEAVAERWLQLQHATRSHVEAFVRPPLAQSAPEAHETVQEALNAREVTMRAIYDADSLRYPGTLEHIRRVAALGEQSRSVSKLPLKLALFDRRTGLVPLVPLGPSSTVQAGLVVHRSALLDALVDLFDIYWQRATPLGIDGEPAPTARAVADEQTILTLLAAGIKDAAVARPLSVSTYTVRRRIAAMIERLGVTNRFQLGLALGRQGWPPDEPPIQDDTSPATR